MNLTSNIFLVSGEAGGTGKFLKINFTTVDTDHEADLLASDCEVIATKASSGQTYTYIASNADTHSQKVGAGTVVLDGTPVDGWVFEHFVIRGEIKDDLSEYKTQKYDIIDAVFDRLSYTVEASIGTGLGTISADGFDIGTGGEVSVYHGESVTFDFYPDEGYYVSSVIADSVQISAPYTLGPITEAGHWIEV
ncbi:MAG: hypothetical protein NWF10_07480, partial [Candidatus Bathyarchaeota archaeon]|nr:hypothetical protein [Candidatus Bathyarchaeota archaeon]